MNHFKRTKLLLAAAIILCLVSMIGASLVQTSGGRIHMEDLTWTGDNGYTVSATLYVPDTATQENPAPGIVAVHGWWNNRGMQDLYAIELARRGYVVLAPDMYGHGDSEFTTWEDLYVDGCGEYTAVQLLADLPYVDTDRIALTGHSSGGDMMGQAVAIDNEQETQLISACLFQASYLSDDAGVNHAAAFGSRDLGIIASQYDEFFYTTTEDSDVYIQAGLPGADDGTEVVSNPPREFILSSEAKNFLNFNQGADGFEGTPEAGRYYETEVDGETATRVIYTPAITHAHVVFSREAVADAIEFFENIFGAPNPIAASNQIWPVKSAFNLMGLVGFLMLFALFPILMLRTPFFESLQAKERTTAMAMPAKKAWFWIPLAISAVFSAVSYYFIIGTMTSKETIVGFFPQTSSLALGLWAALCGIFSLALMTAYYRLYGKKNRFSLVERGVVIKGKALGKTILLALLTVCFAMGILWFADYFFMTDFRFYVVTYRGFNAETANIILRFVPLFLVFYVLNSVSCNCFNDVAIGRKKWLNLVIFGLFNALGIIVYLCIQYGVQRATGFLAFGDTLGQCISGIWAIPTAFFLLITPWISRTIYRATNNPYLAGIINTFIVTIFVVAQSVTVLA